jgi:23S rRNA U2552 (ribose-2'-O)-methylase RlmE/FtsJ
MSVTTEKPPWLTLKWTSNVGEFIKNELYQPICGEWKEDNNIELFNLKERIQPFDKTELWDLANRITNTYERIHTISSRLNLPSSICLLTPLSRSFFKMIEIFHVMKFFETKQKVVKMKSLHLCEGPGGFIEAFFHKAEDHHKNINVSYAMTLRSTHQMIPGWRRATPFLQRHPAVKLVYGPSNTGDIYDVQNQNYLLDLCKKQMHLVTADGGFDFSDDFHAQEKMIFRLLVSSAYIALQTLAVEGDFVLKVFDIQSQTTRDFLTLIGSCFKEWTLYKPVTSRPCNSEWYFLGKSAIHQRDSVVKILAEIRDMLSEEKVIAKLLVENSKEEYIQVLQKERIAKQSAALQNVLSYCENMNNVPIVSINEGLWKDQIAPSKDWCNIFRIASL